MSAGAVALPLVLLAVLPLVAAQRVFFSKYIHGSATVTRALELYNPSCSSVALSEFKVRMQPCSAALYWVLESLMCFVLSMKDIRPLARQIAFSLNGAAWNFASYITLSGTLASQVKHAALASQLVSVFAGGHSMLAKSV